MHAVWSLLGDADTPLDVIGSVHGLVGGRRIGNTNYGKKGTAEAYNQARRMRAARDKRNKKGYVHPAIAARLTRLNAKAVRHVELVGDVGARPLPIKGRGRYRQWTAQALLRCVFGTLPTRQLQRTQRREQPANPRAASTRTAAAHYEASHSYVQKVRNATAMYVLDAQKKDPWEHELVATFVIVVVIMVRILFVDSAALMTLMPHSLP